MKKLLYILLLFSTVLQAQNYSFESVDKRIIPDGWEIIKIVGSVVITDSTVVISTPYRTQELRIQSSLQLYSSDDRIISCINESDYKVKIRMVCDDKLRKYFDLLYYSNEPNNKYFRFCLTQID